MSWWPFAPVKQSGERRGGGSRGGSRLDAPRRRRAGAVVGTLALVSSLLSGTALSIADADTASAAVSASQQWTTSVGVSGATRTFRFGDSGVTAVETNTTVTGTCSFAGSGAGFGGVNANAFFSPTPPAGIGTAGNVCQGPPAGGGNRVSTLTFSKPVLNPVFHVQNLDASRFVISGTSTTNAAIALTALRRNTTLEISGGTLNSTYNPANQTGCQANDGTNPAGACGSVQISAASGAISALRLQNTTNGSTITGTGFNDGWAYALSYPTAPLTKSFSPATIAPGTTSQLTFTIANPANEAQPTLSGMGFTDTLPAGVTVGNGLTTNGNCGSPTFTGSNGAALASGSTAIRAAGVSVAAGSTCTITVTVTAAEPGVYTNDTSNLSTTVANLVPNARTSLTVTSFPQVSCTTDPNIFNTGYDAATGGVRPNNSKDANWQVSGPHAASSTVSMPPAGATWALANVGKVTSAWPDSPYGNAQWISQQTAASPNQGPTAGDWYYRYQFDLDAGVDPSRFELSMNFLADNAVAEVYVNGVAQSGKTTGLPQAPLTEPSANPGIYYYGGFQTANAAETTLSDDWRTGVNSIVVQVKSASPMEGFNAQVRPSVLCPQPEYTVAKSASAASVQEGEALTYTVTLRNTGNVPYTAENPVSFADDLAGVLDDAAYNGDAEVAFSGASSADAPTVEGSRLEWAGPLEVGETATITYSVTVRTPNPGDDILTNTVVPGEGGVCDPSGACTTSTPVQSFSVTKTADTDDVVPGDEITYTLIVRNTGQLAYTDADPAALRDDLSEVLDDATFDGTVNADGGQATYSEPRITWSGPLAVGETVTITYTVTVNDPATGDERLGNAVVTSNGGDCPEGTDNPACRVDIPTGSFTVAKAASVTATGPGETVTYTVTVRNTGDVAYTAERPASFVDDLSDVLDDAALSGELPDGATVAGSTLRWSGPLAVGDTVTITYTVTVGDDGSGNRVLRNAVRPTAGGGSCVEDACSTTTPVRSFTVAKSSSAADRVRPGDVVTYTITVTNTGGADYTDDAPASFTDDLADVLDDATVTQQPTGGATITGMELSWSGPLAMGAPVVVTYAVTVGPAGSGDGVLTNAVAAGTGGSCATADGCTTTSAVEALAISKTVDPSGDLTAGDTVTYTVTATSIGAAPYTEDVPAVVFDDLSGVLDDGVYNADAAAVASDGTDVPAPALVEPAHLSWSGPLASGESVEITYTVTLSGDGDGVVRNVAWVPTTPPPPGEVPPTPDCDPATTEGTDPETGEPCAAVESELPRLSVAKSSDVTDLPADGGVVTYEVTVTNEGPGAYTEDAPASMTDDLSEVLDDAEFGGFVGPDTGAVFDEDAQELTWSGPLADGDSVTIRYTVTYDQNAGDNVLFNRACIPSGEELPGAEPCAQVRIPAAELDIAKTVDPADGSAVAAGQEVTYTLSFTGAGEAPADVDKVDDLSGVLDDATLVEGSIVTSNPALTATLDGDRLAISGGVPNGETYTVSYAVVVDPYAEQGDHVLGNVVTRADGTCDVEGCPRTENPIRHLSVEKSATPAEGVLPGDVVEYTVTVTSDGEGDYTAEVPAAVSDDMTDVLDDAAYNGDVTAVASDGSDVPAPVFDGGVLGWSGPLAAGETVTITYSVTVTNLGDNDLVNTAAVVCGEGEICDPPVPPVEILLPRITPGKASDPGSGADVAAGDVITYTLTWTNDGKAAGPVDSTDDLSGVLDDAELTALPVVDDAHAETSSALLDPEAMTIRVTGTLAPGETLTVTYQVTVLPDGQRGDNVLPNVNIPDVPPVVPPVGCEDCPPPFVPPATEHRVAEIVDSKTVDPGSSASIRPGQELTYTLTFENIGAASGTVDRVDDLTHVLDDADVTAAPTASDATLSVSEIADARFAVTGELEAGQKVTVTYTVTVKAVDQLGDGQLANFLLDPQVAPPAEAVCGSGEDCTFNPVSDVTVTKASDPEDGSEVRDGQAVTYTLTFANRGRAIEEIDYTDHMRAVLDDADLTQAPTASDDALTVTSLDDGAFSVAGQLVAGQSVTVTYTVTVRAYAEQGDHSLGNVVAVTGQAPPADCSTDSDLCTEHPVAEPAADEPPLSNEPPLAATGGAIAVSVVGGALMLLIAGVVLLVARRRRSLTEE
jgi:uncharacterized repeat protein (TIGR01451 family)/fimbrial isopeptide formation D2 family protein